jgi:hypothetical protein
VESPKPLGLVRESYLKTEVEAWISRYVELYYITTCIIIEEMARTISRLLNNIALGLDRILNKALKTYRPLIAPWLVDVARACFTIGYYPRLGRSITTVVLRKEGKVDYLILGSYCPIALENTLSKILEKVIVDHIADTVEEHALLL